MFNLIPILLVVILGGAAYHYRGPLKTKLDQAKEKNERYSQQAATQPTATPSYAAQDVAVPTASPLPASSPTPTPIPSLADLQPQTQTTLPAAGPQLSAVRGLWLALAGLMAGMATYRRRLKLKLKRAWRNIDIVS